MTINLHKSLLLVAFLALGSAHGGALVPQPHPNPLPGAVEQARNPREGRYWDSLYSSVVGTVASGGNAFGQILNNLGGDGAIGRIGLAITKVSEHYAGKVKFVLFTQKNPVIGFELNVGNIAASPFVKGKPVLVIIHGFTPAGYFQKSSDNLISSFRMKDAAIKAKIPHNILLVDWCGLSSDGAYIFSSYSTATTADRVADMLVWLVKNEYVPSPKDVRITGHSLGGHTAGIAGKKFNQKYGQKIARIDAIDPAGPNFDYNPSEFQLTKYDAEYVHVMHCNIHMLGSHFNRGTSDFYPNGGDSLPGCEKPTGYFQLLKASASLHICNHVRCIDLYIETFEDAKLGCKCESWTKYLANECDCDKQKEKPRIGYYCPTTAEGAYYMNITLKTEYQVLPDNSSSYNNYGAGGVSKEEKPITLDKGGMMESITGNGTGTEKLDGKMLEATTPPPSPSTTDGPLQFSDEVIGWALPKATTTTPSTKSRKRGKGKTTEAPGTGTTGKPGDSKGKSTTPEPEEEDDEATKGLSWSG